MAVEQSRFCGEQAVMDFVEAYYGFRPDTVERLELGSANCFRVQADGAAFFLKEFQEKFSRAALENEVRVCQLVSGQIPTSQFIKNRQGTVICEAEGRLFHLQRFQEGHTRPRNRFDGALLEQAALTLGKIHQCLDGKLVLPEGFPAPWFDGWSRERTLEKYEKILARKLQQDTGGRNQKLIAACRTKLALLKDFDLDYGKFKGLRTVNSHGDYNNLQILLDEQGRLCAVIDFSSAACLPAVWELMRSYTLSAVECAGGDWLDLDGLKRYVDAYLTVRRLPLFDVVHMADFYYFDLLRSAYGFDAEDEASAEFAVWRTNMCAYLGRNTGGIRAYLRDAYENVLE